MTITVNTPDGGTAQFPDGTPTSTMTSVLQAKFGGPSAASAQPSDTDYSNSPFSAAARTFESSADWGTGDLLRALATGKKPSETAAQSSAAAASLPWYIRYPTEAAGYGVGLVNLLDPVTDAAEAGALGLGASAKIAGLAGLGAEGATVGAVHHVASTDDPGLSDTAGAALGGAALNTAAGSVAPLINPALQKVLGKRGTVDPAAAQASTKATSDAAYAALHQVPVSPTVVDQSIGAAMPRPNSSQGTGMSPGFQNQVNTIRDALQSHQVQGTQPTLGDVNSWKRQVNEAASTSIDGGIAHQIGTGLDGVMNAQAPGLNQAAQTAFKQSQMAENLGTWQRQLQETGGNLGQKPFTEAEKYYTPGTPDYQTVAGLSNQGAGDHGISWMVPHILGTGLSFAGEHVFGVPGAIAGELGGYVAGKKLIKSYNQRRGIAGLQAAYPQLTGVQPTGGRQAPQVNDPNAVGNQIKNLMMGMAY